MLLHDLNPHTPTQSCFNGQTQSEYYQCEMGGSCPGPCTGCVAGYYGASCQYACPSCVHGTCSKRLLLLCVKCGCFVFDLFLLCSSCADDGVSGNGLCSCTIGWAPPLCSTCAQGYSGPSCGARRSFASFCRSWTIVCRLHQRNVQQPWFVLVLWLVQLQQRLRGRSVCAVRGWMVRLPELPTYAWRCSCLCSLFSRLQAAVVALSPVIQ